MSDNYVSANNSMLNIFGLNTAVVLNKLKEWRRWSVEKEGREIFYIRMQELSDQTGLSRVTIHKSLGFLSDIGLIVTGKYKADAQDVFKPVPLKVNGVYLKRSTNPTVIKLNFEGYEKLNKLGKPDKKIKTKDDFYEYAKSKRCEMIFLNFFFNEREDDSFFVKSLSSKVFKDKESMTGNLRRKDFYDKSDLRRKEKHDLNDLHIYTPIINKKPITNNIRRKSKTLPRTDICSSETSERINDQKDNFFVDELKSNHLESIHSENSNEEIMNQPSIKNQSETNVVEKEIEIPIKIVDTEISTPELKSSQTNDHKNINSSEAGIDNNSSNLPVARVHHHNETSFEMRAVRFMWSEINKRINKKQQPNFKKWADEIEKLKRIDCRDEKEIGLLLKDIYGPHTCFWSGIILSPKNFRKHYYQMLSQKAAGTLIKRSYQEEREEKKRKETEELYKSWEGIDESQDRFIEDDHPDLGSRV